MSENSESALVSIDCSRRRFVQGVAGSSLMLGLGLKSNFLSAAIDRSQSGQTTLNGRAFDLQIAETTVNFTGVNAIATTVNGSLPAPTLRFKQGDVVTLRVTNYLKESSSIHWHGLILPSNMDGVPGISNDFAGIAPGESFTYKFKLIQSGTYWYHSHSGFQEQTGLYGAIVVDPVEAEPFAYDREYVVMLSDWSDEDPTDIYSKLKKLSHYYNFKERTHADLMADIKSRGLSATWADRSMWNEMRMSQRDLSDVTGYTYTYLMNGITPAEGWSGLFNKGEKIRLRFINGSAMTFFDVRIPGLKMTVVAADGQYVEPVTIDEFRIGVAETYDVVVEPDSDTAYTLFAQSIDRSGYARGTLTPDINLNAEVPELDRVANLSHSDMAMDMSTMDHSAMGHGTSSDKDMSTMDHAAMGHGTSSDKDMSTMDHAAMGHGTSSDKDMSTMDHAAMGHGTSSDKDMSTMDHAAMGHGASSDKDMSTMDHAAMGHGSSSDKDMNAMDHAAMGHDAPQPMGQGPANNMSTKTISDWNIESSINASMADSNHPGMSHESSADNKAKMVARPSDFSTGKLVHAKTEYGPHIDMLAEAAEYRLNDPGVGLRGNGRKVLTYADLKNLRTTANDRDPDREIELHLTGNMSRYMWSINGIKHNRAEPLRWKIGERLRITFINDTMMNHPMHLHGMWSDLETGDNNFLPRKHTVIVQPGSRISYRVTVDAQGGWAYHCHLLYHMLGMFRTVIVS